MMVCILCSQPRNINDTYLSLFFSPLLSHPSSFSRLFLFNIFLFLFQVFCFIGMALFVLLGVFMVIFLMKDWNSKVVKATVKEAVTG